MLRPTLAIVLLGGSLLLAGCVSRSEYKKNAALLEECRTDKVSAQTAMSSCEERYAKEVKRWENLDSVVATVVPNALNEFKSEREDILKMVPETARQEVGSYLDDLTDAMGHGFQVLRDQNENMALELEVAQTKLDALQARADSIGTQTTSINQTLEGSLREALDAQRKMRQQAIALVDSVQSFDRTYVSVRDSDSRLKLNRNQRETIEQFHARLVGSLTALGGAPGGPVATADPASASRSSDSGR